MKRNVMAILPMIGFAAAAMFAIDAHAAAAHAVANVASLMPSFTAEGISQAIAAASALGVAGSTVASHVENHAASTKWFRIMTEGPTIDGRTIERATIEQMAAAYDPKLYGARINLEHIRGYDPKSLFKAYGDVLALKAEEVDGKMALFAQIAPTPDLVAMTKDKQKVYTSCEVHPSFADSKQAYLIGLAVTDSPASLGTEVLAFSARNTANLFSVALETSFELETQPAGIADQVKRIFSTVATLLGKKEDNDAARFADMHQAVELLANHGKDQAEAFGAQSAQLGALDTKHADLLARHEKLAQDFASLQQTLSTTPANPARPHNTGGNGTVKTDC